MSTYDEKIEMNEQRNGTSNALRGAASEALFAIGKALYADTLDRRDLEHAHAALNAALHDEFVTGDGKP